MTGVSQGPTQRSAGSGAACVDLEPQDRRARSTMNIHERLALRPLVIPQRTDVAACGPVVLRTARRPRFPLAWTILGCQCLIVSTPPNLPIVVVVIFRSCHDSPKHGLVSTGIEPLIARTIGHCYCGVTGAARAGSARMGADRRPPVAARPRLRSNVPIVIPSKTAAQMQ
jgi:hypothetical protein